jgi:foldase protein PrsA
MVRKELNLTDEKLREYYNQHIDTYTNMEVKASHILVEKEEEAKNILEKINKGEDFGELAKKYSKDPGSKEKGGDLGYFSKGMMVPEFEKAAFALKKGEISAPVKTKHGYHIIKVVDTKKETKKFEEVKGNIERTLIDQTMMTKTNDMKKEFKIKKYPENIK